MEQIVKNNYGQNAQNVEGDQIQANNYISFTISSSNDLNITIDTDKIKEEYLQHYQLYETELDGIFDNIEERCATNLLNDLIDLKYKSTSNQHITVSTLHCTSLTHNLTQTGVTSKKFEIQEELKKEKELSNRLSILFNLILSDVIDLNSMDDAAMLIETIYLLSTSDFFDPILEDKVITNFYQDFEISKDLFDDTQLEKLILTYLQDNKSEDITIPSTLLLHYNDININIKYPLDKKIGHFDNNAKKDIIEDNHFLAHFYAQLIHISIFEGCSEQISFDPSNYSVKLSFSEAQKEVRSIIKKYAYDNHGSPKGIFNPFKYTLSATQNPI